MRYIAVHCMTGQENAVAVELARYGSVIKDVVVGTERVVHEFSKKHTRATSVHAITGYVFVGFDEWINDIYHLVKSVQGVIRPLITYVKGSTLSNKGLVEGLLTREEVYGFLPETETEVRLHVTSEEKRKVADWITQMIAKAREFIRRKKERWVSIPGDVFTSATTPIKTTSEAWEYLFSLYTPAMARDG